MESRFGPSSPRTENWPSEARRAAFGLERNFVSTISSDATTRLLQTRLRDRIPLEHDAISWRDREHDKFAEEFEQTMLVVGRFLEASNQHIPFLLRKAERIEEYLQQR